MSNQKEINMQKVILSGFSFKTFYIGLIFIFTFTVHAQTVRNSDYKADRSLKSSAKINPSTYAMELSIPIGDYSGRAGTGIPVSFMYSSKVWQIYAPPGSSWQSASGIKTDTEPLYAKRTSAGWTSSLTVPRLDFGDNIYEAMHSTSVYDGQPYAQGDFTPSENYALYYIKRVQLQMPDGSTHELRKDDSRYSYGTVQSPGPSGTPDQTTTYLSVDGSKMRLEVSSTQKVLYMPDGGRYFFSTATAACPTAVCADTFIDRSGNKMTYDATNRRWTDTLGRVLQDPFPLNWGSQQQTVGDIPVSYPGFGANGTLDVTFTWQHLSEIIPQLSYTANYYCPSNFQYPLSGPALFTNPELSLVRVCGGYTANPPKFDPVVLTKITFPNNQKYEFKYNPYGEIEKIVYPSGGYERFLYGQVALMQPQSSSYDQANRGVTDRWVSTKGDGTDEIHWTYQKTSTSGVITEPNGTRTQQFINYDNGQQPYGFGDAKVGSVSEVRTLAPLPSTQILRRRLIGYDVTGPLAGGYSTATRDARPSKEVSIIFEPGETYALAQMTETVYETPGSNGVPTDPAYFAALNPKQIKVYNYVAVSSTTAASANIEDAVLWFSAAAPFKTTEMQYLYDANYMARNVSGLIIEERIKDEAGQIKAKIQMGYDDSGYDLASTGTLPTAAANSWVDPVTELGSIIGSKRGLVTTVKRYYDTNNDYYIETHSFYDQYGNLRKMRDGRNEDTLTEYSQTFAFAYPTSVTTPTPSDGIYGSNTSFTTITDYDYRSGLPTSTTDINGQATQLSYADPATGVIDPLLRLRKVTAPNGQQIITEYGAGTSEATRFIKIKTQIDTEKWNESYSWFDGIGRNIKTQSVDSDGDVFVETEYDNMGRIKKVSNPYRANETVYWTEKFYDDLSRPTKVKTLNDGAYTLTDYSLATTGNQIGTVVNITDQAGKQRRSITSALGQLTRVDEPVETRDSNGNITSVTLGPINAPAQPTVYGYDTLNNLTTVQQNGLTTQQCGGTVPTCSQTRNFVYDALSRLKTADNPESGAIQYTYDANGNLKTKRDARGIKTVYDYDALNRLAKRCYRVIGTGSLGMTTCVGNTETAEPNSYDTSYTYDNLPNAKGKLIKVDNGFSKTEYTQFDILGRVTKSKQTTDGVSYGSEMEYVYNLSGALIEETYPSTRKVRNVLDNNGDLSLVQSKKTAAYGYWNYANNFTYTAAGAVSSMQLGNFKWESTVFNSRLRPTQIALGTTQAAYNVLKLNYDYGSTANNGNIQSQTITVPTVGVNTGFSAVQTYTYDSLNRIHDAKENIDGNTTPEWKQTFTYDRFGNRNFDEANTTATATFLKECGTAPNKTVCAADVPIVNPSINTAKNQLNGYTFDNSGNTTKDAQNKKFTYDADNKQIKVETVDSNNNVTGTIGEYFYDGDGKRVKKIAYENNQPPVTTIFVYNGGGQLVAEYSTQTSQTPSVNYLTSDHLGSPRINTDQNGAVTARHDYQPFGEEISSSQRTQGFKYNPDEIRQKFTSYERDAETKLNFAQARYQNDIYGRFSTPDPMMASAMRANPQTFNRYSYVGNNPINYIDPTGMLTDFVDKETGKITHIDDGRDQVLVANTSQINELVAASQTAFQPSNYEGYWHKLAKLEKSDKHNLHMTFSQFNHLANTLYAESSGGYLETFGIFNVLENRAAADGNTVMDQATVAAGVFGANSTMYETEQGAAADEKRSNVRRALADARTSGIDVSNGAYFWDGRDFNGKANKNGGYKARYVPGYLFNNPQHDLYNQGSNMVKNTYVYQSTAAIGATTFTKLYNQGRRWNIPK
jgi:RHS repeat-associated protein